MKIGINIHIPNYFHVYLYLYLTYLDIFSCMFIPIFNIFRHIFMYIYTYFHVYFYLFLHISTYFYHKSVVFYSSLPHKCGILLQIATKVWYFTTVYRYLPHKCGILLQFDTKVWARNVPQNGGQTNYVPQVPHLGYRWGTKTSDAQDGKYLIF